MKMFKLARRYGAKAGAALVAGAVLVPAHAAIDVTDVVAEIDSTIAAAGPIPTIGSAVLLVIVAIAAFKWVRRAVS